MPCIYFIRVRGARNAALPFSPLPSVRGVVPGHVSGSVATRCWAPVSGREKMVSVRGGERAPGTNRGNKTTWRKEWGEKVEGEGER